MAKPPPPPPAPMGSNWILSAEQLADIAARTEKILALERQRESLNASINAERKGIRAHGVDLDAWRAAKRRLAMDEEDREQFDRSQAMCNQALGVPIQGDLFAAPDGDDSGIPGKLN